MLLIIKLFKKKITRETGAMCGQGGGWCPSGPGLIPLSTRQVPRCLLENCPSFYVNIFINYVQLSLLNSDFDYRCAKKMGSKLTV